MMRRLPLGLILLMLGVLFAPVPGRGEEPKLTGREVIRRAEDLMYRLQDQSAEVVLKTVRPGSHEHTHKTRWFWKNFQGRDGIESKTVFYTTYPPSARGEAILIWDYTQSGKPDDLWLYLPGLRQTRRLTTRDRHEAFHGSDLTFEELGQRQLDLERHTMIGQGMCIGVPCYVVDSVPLEAESPYSRRRSWVAKGTWTTLKVEAFDRQGSLFKTQTVRWREQDGLQLWLGTRVMNHLTSSQTIVDVNDLVTNASLMDDRFTLRTLPRLP